MIINSKEEEMKSVGDMSEVCSQLVLKCLYLARIGRLDVLWSVNKRARSVTHWTQACDRRLARLYIHHTNNFRQHCHVGNAAQHCRLRLSQDPTQTLLAILRTQNQPQGTVVHIRKSHVRTNKLDVQATDCCFAQFYRV